MENFPRPVHHPLAEDLGRRQAFLCSITPFQGLPQSEIATVAANLETETLPPEHVLFAQDETVITHVLLLERGRLERTIQANGQVRVEEILETGRIYGGISILYNNGISTSSVRCLEETTVHWLDRENFFRLCAKHPAFAGHFKATLREEDKLLAPAPVATTGIPDLEAQASFLSASVKGITQAFPACTGATPIRRAAELMTTSRQSAIMVTDDNGQPQGIITDYDLRKKVVAGGLNSDTPAAAIMSTPLLTVPADTRIFEAMLTMMRRQVKHLGVLRGERMEGMVTERDLFLASTPSPDHPGARHPHRPDCGDQGRLCPTAAADRATDRRRRQGRPPQRHHHRLYRCGHDSASWRWPKGIPGPPPAPFAFLLFGSEGRREQTLKTDQDNAIVFEDVPVEKEQGSGPIFSLGTRVCDDG
jgi:CBS domain-containing protein